METPDVVLDASAQHAQRRRRHSVVVLEPRRARRLALRPPRHPRPDRRPPLRRCGRRPVGCAVSVGPGPLAAPVRRVAHPHQPRRRRRRPRPRNLAREVPRRRRRVESRADHPPPRPAPHANSTTPAATTTCSHGIDYLVEAAHGCGWKEFIDACNRWLAHADPDGKLPDETTRTAPLHGQEARRRRPRADRSTSTPSAATPSATPSNAKHSASSASTPTRRNPEAERTQPHPTHGRRVGQPRDARRRSAPTATVGAPLVHVVVGLEILEEAMCRRAAAEAGVLPIGPDGQPLRRRPRHRPRQSAAPLRTRRRHTTTPEPGPRPARRRHHPPHRPRYRRRDPRHRPRFAKFPQYMKDAATAAQRGQCSEPGCDARPSWLEADHIVPWTPNGPTATRNLQMLCGAGNHAKSNQPNPPPPTPPARAKATRPPRSQTARPGHRSRRAEPPDDGPEPGSRPGDPSPPRNC